MNTELLEALDMLEREMRISRNVLFDAIKNSLLIACKNQFGRNDNIDVEIDEDTADYHVIAHKEVVENAADVSDKMMQISLADAKAVAPGAQVGDVVNVELPSRDFGRIAAMSAKNVMLQKIREEERNVTYRKYYEKEKHVVTGVIQRVMGKNVIMNLDDRTDATLPEKEQVKTERYRSGQRMKVYVLDVKSTNKGPRITVSRTHPELIRCLFENEVSEIADGTVEIRSIAREAGSRTKIAVLSNNENVDPIGACVGTNGARVSAVVDELGGEKIDIVNWSDNPAQFVTNALSPATVLDVFLDPDEKTAKVIVPEDQLSLAIGKEGQNARLAAKLTGYKIDIKDEVQARDAVGFREEDYYDEEYIDEEFGEGYEDGPTYYDENGQYIGPVEEPADGGQGDDADGQ